MRHFNAYLRFDARQLLDVSLFATVHPCHGKDEGAEAAGTTGMPATVVHLRQLGSLPVINRRAPIELTSSDSVRLAQLRAGVKVYICYRRDRAECQDLRLSGR